MMFASGMIWTLDSNLSAKDKASLKGLMFGPRREKS
jgi:hypothetical protein